MEVHETELTVEVVVRTNGARTDHDKVVQWVADSLRSAPKRIKGGVVEVKVFDRGANAGYGSSSFGEGLPQVQPS